MSYDIRFGVKVAGAPDDCFAVIGAPEYDDPTYNLGEMFRACMDWDFEQGKWYSLMGVMPKIRRGIEELSEHPGEYMKYEPVNGWGTVGSAIKTLKSIEEWLDKENWGGIGGSWNADIPYDCIWIVW